MACQERHFVFNHDVLTHWIVQSSLFIALYTGTFQRIHISNTFIHTDGSFRVSSTSDLHMRAGKLHTERKERWSNSKRFLAVNQPYEVNIASCGALVTPLDVFLIFTFYREMLVFQRKNKCIAIIPVYFPICWITSGIRCVLLQFHNNIIPTHIHYTVFHFKVL